MRAVLDFILLRAATFLAASTLAIALVVMAAQVVFRYLFADSLIWSEELARYALVWSSMLGSVAAYRQGAHVGVTDLFTRLPSPLQAVAARLIHLLVLGFACLFTWESWALAMRSFARNQVMAAMDLNIGWVQLAFPVAGLLLIIGALEAAWLGVRPSSGVSSV